MIDIWWVDWLVSWLPGGVAGWLIGLAHGLGGQLATCLIGKVGGEKREASSQRRTDAPLCKVEGPVGSAREQASQKL